MVVVEQRPFDPLSVVRIPVHRHHAGKITGPDIDAPAIPVEEPNVVRPTISSRHEGIQDVCVVMDDREVAM